MITNDILTDDSIMLFGRYKGKTLGEIPDNYLEWLRNTLHTNRRLSAYEQRLLIYLDDNKDAIHNNIKKIVSHESH